MLIRIVTNIIEHLFFPGAMLSSTYVFSQVNFTTALKAGTVFLICKGGIIIVAAC